MYISYGSTDPSIVRYFSKRVPRSLSTTSGQFVIDSATVAAWSYAKALFADPAATLDDLREAVTTLEETTRTAQRVLGGAHPTAVDIEVSLRNARAALATRETPPGTR